MAQIGQVETEETESWNGNRELKREIELDLSPSLINVNEPILIGKLITIIQGL